MKLWGKLHVRDARGTQRKAVSPDQRVRIPTQHPEHRGKVECKILWKPTQRYPLGSQGGLQILPKEIPHSCDLKDNKVAGDHLPGRGSDMQKAKWQEAPECVGGSQGEEGERGLSRGWRVTDVRSYRPRRPC